MSKSGRKVTSSAVLCGALLGMSAQAATAGPEFLYTLHNNQALRGWSINPATGALTSIAGSPWIVPEFPFLLGMGKGPAGRFLYPVTPDSDEIVGFAANPTTGVLTPVPGSPYPFPPAGVAMTVHPNGKFAYLNAIAYDISPFRVDPTTGRLTASGNTATAGVYPRLAIEPNGKCLYSLNKGIFFINDPAKVKNISAFSIDQTTGALTEVSGSPFPTGNYPVFFAFHPSGKYLIVSSSVSTDIRTYSIDPNTCGLTQKAILTKATGDIAFEPTGHFLYATAGGVANTIATLSFNAATGALTRAGTVSVGKLTVSRLAVDPAGKYLIAVESDLSSPTSPPILAASYTINATTGALTLSSGPTSIDGDSPVEDLAISGTP
jgi:6-phosphogluconolactonase